MPIFVLMSSRRRSLMMLASALLLVVAAGCGGSGSASSEGEQLPAFCFEALAAYPAPPADRPSYQVSLAVSAARRSVPGTMRVTFTPDLEVQRLVFRLWPNGPSGHGARLTVGALRVGGAPVRPERPDRTTLVVPLASPVAAGATVSVSLSFRLTVPWSDEDRIGSNGRVVRLGSFLPLLSWEPGVGWAVDLPARIPSESATSPVADWDVTVRAPHGERVIATGAEISPGRWRATAVRDFALVAGRLRVAMGTAQAPDDVALTVGIGAGTADPGRLLDEARADLERLAREYGPYPWPTFSAVIVPGLEESGIEYPNLVFLGADARATSHEVAHQWFYSLVGNDQGRDPWLDEAPATWAGGRVGGNLAAFLTVPVPAAAGGHLGEPMTFWDRHPRLYFPGVYAQGAQALAGTGSEAGVRCALRRYVAANAYAIATPQDLLDALAAVYPDARARFEPYGVR
jgi:hypothetical protein